MCSDCLGDDTANDKWLLPKEMFISLKNSEEILTTVFDASGNKRSFGQRPLQNITCIVYLILGHSTIKTY